MRAPDFNVRRLAGLCFVSLLVGCSAAIVDGVSPGGSGGHGGEGASGGSGGEGGQGGNGGGDGTIVVPPGCDVEQYRGMTLEQIADRYALMVHPNMLRAQGGCASCHAASQARLFTVQNDPASTFYEARQGGFFKAQPGSLVDRLSAADVNVMMPRGAARWTQSEVDAVASISCALAAYDLAGTVPADEQFPPNLLTPYSGTPVTAYDNDFLVYPQLRAKVSAIFQDDWVRGMTDNWIKNLGLFGGVDFVSRFVEARVATPEFLLGLDALAPDICGKAASAKTGPFSGLDTALPLVDIPGSSTRPFEAEGKSVTVVPATGAGQLRATEYLFSNNGSLNVTVDLPPGQYQVTVRARAMVDGSGVGPLVEVKFGATVAGTMTYTDTVNYVDKTTNAVTLSTGGPQLISVAYINNSNPPVQAGTDRNIYIDKFSVIGPLGPGTGTAREDAARAGLSTIYTRMLYRAPTSAELSSTYALLKELAGLGTTAEAWSGTCEALVRHPDFLFSLPPSFETSTGITKSQMLLVDASLRLTGRPPKSADLQALASGTSFESLIDTYLASPEVRDWYFSRMQLRLESQGTVSTDEPARLFTFLAMSGSPMKELFTGDYGVDTSFNKVPRPPEHGKSGLLTMKGFISNKPGLPHYNYSARVLSDFLGTIFEVPQEVFDQRGTATATSTVDPKSICYSCHQNLTPLAHQRLRWADDGTYQANDPDGKPIDDSDRNMVPSYAFKGTGMEAFGAVASRKEPFIRRTLNAQYRLLMGREMRAVEDERDIYKQLWDTSVASGGNLKAVLKAIATSPRYQRIP